MSIGATELSLCVAATKVNLDGTTGMQLIGGRSRSMCFIPAFMTPWDASIACCWLGWLQTSALVVVLLLYTQQPTSK